MTSLHMASHCYACYCEGYIVFIDIKNNEYSALPSPQLSHLSGDQLDKEIISFLTNQTYNNSIIVPAPEGKPFKLTNVTKPAHDLPPTTWWPETTVSIIDIFRFIKCIIYGLLFSGVLPLRSFVERKRKMRPAICRQQVPSRQALETVAAKFFYLAPVFLSQVDKCYLVSICLYRFFKYYDIDVRLIFGVSMVPFHAHCWIQFDDIVIGDTLLNISLFRPILEV